MEIHPLVHEVVQEVGRLPRRQLSFFRTREQQRRHPPALDAVAPGDLANDKGLVEVARSHGVECWWVTTVLLSSTKEGHLTADEATDLLYDLVNEGMNLHPRVYSQVQKKLRELED